MANSDKTVDDDDCIILYLHTNLCAGSVKHWGMRGWCAQVSSVRAF